jgi:phenylpropionate dioxygenase-like ring-hydroxylating dioxygenase large terminal subunit
MDNTRIAAGQDLRRTGIHRDHWYPVARSKDLKAGGTLPVVFAGEPVVLVRTAAGSLFGLADRCAHRQVPLSAGTVHGERLKCGYHGWAYAASGQCVDVPYLGKNQTRPNGVRPYPCREAYGLLFIFPGDPAKADELRFPKIPTWADGDYKTRYLDREVKCHYSFMHENLLDMNHQFLHRRLMGGIRTVLVGSSKGPGWVEAVYRFDRTSGSQSLGEKFIIATGDGAVKKREHDLMTIRTEYPYQTLRFIGAEDEKPSLDLWLSYAPTDTAQRANHSMGLMMIRKPSLPGLIHVLWPFIVLFTEGIFKQDRDIVELEQKAHDAQGADWNQEIFPVILGLRELLLAEGVPLKDAASV